MRIGSEVEPQSQAEFVRGRCGDFCKCRRNAANLKLSALADSSSTGGPSVGTKDHIGGFGILDAANMDEAAAWECKAVVACRASVEMREFLPMPTE